MQSADEFLRDLEDGEAGHFLVERRLDRAWLCVFPPGRNGRPVRLADVLARLELFQLASYDRLAIEEIVERADGEFHEAGDWPAPPAIDAEIRVSISDDELTASVEIHPPRFGGREATAERIREALQVAGVTHGVDEDQLARIAASEGLEPGESSDAPRRRAVYTLARGKLPGPGRPARIAHKFDPHPRAAPAPAPSESSRVDFRKLNVIQTCMSGDLLAELESGVRGTPGWTVRGRELPPRESGAPELLAGANTELSSDGQRLYAKIAGHVRFQNVDSDQRARISVEEVLEVERVDYSIGHIDFPGTVRIKSEVLDGFEVRAVGDILIEETVGAVRLFAQGDIVLSGGAVLRGEGQIEAQGDVYARFFQDAHVLAQGSIFVEEAAFNSHLTAGRDVVITAGRGELIGGTTLAGSSVHANKIGSRIEPLTQITVGITPETMQRMQALNREYDEKQQTLRRAENHLLQLEEGRKRGRKIEAGEEETRAKLGLIVERYRKTLRNLDEQRKRLHNAADPPPGAVIIAEEELFPNVEASFGASVRKYRVEGRPISGRSRFLLEDGRVRLLRQFEL